MAITIAGNHLLPEVYDGMKEGDILYYVDSSKYFKEGFTDIDRL